MASVALEIPDDLLTKLSSDGKDAGQRLRLAAAFSLCSRGQFTTSQAARLAGLTHPLANPGTGAIVDDQAARNCAAALGIPHQGTLALIIFAKQQGLVPAARPLVELLRQEGMYLSDQIMNQALSQIGE